MDKFKDRLKVNFGKINNALEELIMDLNGRNEEKVQIRMKVLSGCISEAIKDTDFEAELIENDVKNFYDEDIVLNEIVRKRDLNPVQYILRENSIESMTENLSVISSRIGDKIKKYIEEDSIKIGIKNKDRFINTLDELNRNLKRRNISLIDTINEVENYELEYYNPKLYSLNFKNYVEEVRKSKLNIKEFTPEILKNILDNLKLQKLSNNFLKSKEELFCKCTKYTNSIDIARRQDELEYNGEKTERIFLASSNEYRYSQMHIKQSVIEKLSKEKLQKIYDASNLSKSKSSSVPIHLSNEEIKEYKSRNNKDNIFNKLSNYNLHRGKE